MSAAAPAIGRTVKHSRLDHQRIAVWLVAGGIHVFAPDGKVEDFIFCGGAPTNCAFDGEILWVTNAGVLAASTEPSYAGTLLKVKIPGGGAPTHHGRISPRARA